MSDIFISYAHDDEDIVRKIVTGLESLGLSVWWDREIVGGALYAAEIQQHIDEAKAVIALWSEASVQSTWVADEARAGQESGKLIPLCLDETVAPMGFRQYQSINFATWDGSLEHDSFVDLRAALKRLGLDQDLAADVAGHAAPKLKPTQADALKKRPVQLGLAVTGLATIAVLAFFLGQPFTSLNKPGGTVDPPVDDAGQITEKARTSIAVLPFEHYGAAENEYFSDGVSEEILNLLAKTKGLRVAARTSSFQYRGEKTDIPSIGNALGVEAILEGSIRWAGDRLRVTAQLIDVETGFHLWSETYDREQGDIFALQDDICNRIVSSLRIQMSGETPITATSQPTDFQAYNAYLRGHHEMSKRTPEGLVLAGNLMNEALAIDPNYAPALATKASLLILKSGRSRGTIPIAEVQSEVNAILDELFARNPSSADAYVVKGLLLTQLDRDEEALAAFDMAIRVNPNHVDVHGWRGLVLSRMYRDQESYEAYKTAAALDPLSTIVQYNLVVSALDVEPYTKVMEHLAVMKKYEGSMTSMVTAALFLVQGNYGKWADLYLDYQEQLARGGSIKPWNSVAVGKILFSDWQPGPESDREMVHRYLFYEDPMELLVSEKFKAFDFSPFADTKTLVFLHLLLGQEEEATGILLEDADLLKENGGALFEDYQAVIGITAPRALWLLKNAGQPLEAAKVEEDFKAFLKRADKQQLSAATWLERANFAALTGNEKQAIAHLRKRQEFGLIFDFHLAAPWFDSIRQSPDFLAIEDKNLELINAERTKLGWAPFSKTPLRAWQQE